MFFQQRFDSKPLIVHDNAVAAEMHHPPPIPIEAIVQKKRVHNPLRTFRISQHIRQNERCVQENHLDSGSAAKKSALRL